jgi:hypothetical protein
MSYQIFLLHSWGLETLCKGVLMHHWLGLVLSFLGLCDSMQWSPHAPLARSSYFHSWGLVTPCKGVLLHNWLGLVISFLGLCDSMQGSLVTPCKGVFMHEWLGLVTSFLGLCDCMQGSPHASLARSCYFIPGVL